MMTWCVCHIPVPVRLSTLRALGELRVPLEINISESGDHTNKRTPDCPIAKDIRVGSHCKAKTRTSNINTSGNCQPDLSIQEYTLHVSGLLSINVMQ